MHMKKIFTLLFISLLSFSVAFSQTIPNSSFENWIPYSSACASGERPTGWQTTDSLSVCYFAGHTAVKEGVDKCDALYSIKLTSVISPLKAPGVATNGILSATAASGGTPDTARSAQLTGCYKYVPQAGDTGIISAFLFRWNGVSRDTIASIRQLLLTTVSTMTNFNFNFTYKDWSHQPDTVLIVLQSSPALNSAQANSTLIVDNLAMIGYVGINENKIIRSINIFPQPAQDGLNIHVELAQNVSLKYEIADLTGRKILSGKLESANEKIDIRNLSRGNYFVSLLNDGAIVYSTKFIVSK